METRQTGFRALVVCPPHLIEKWPREICGVASSRVVQARPILSLGDLLDFRRTAEDADTAGEEGLHFAVISAEILKLGSGWRGAAVPSKTKTFRMVVKDEEGKETETRVPALTCPRCGDEVVYQDTENDGEPRSIVDLAELSEMRLKCSSCAEPLYQAVSRYARPRWPISTYVRRKMRKWFDLLIVDEAHEAKGATTDRGHAAGEVIGAAKKVVALTGTFFGGTASSIFYLLHRLSTDFRSEYGWNDVARFVDHYGVVETTTYGKDRSSGGGYGAYSGLRRSHKVVRERPGVSPGMVRLILPNTAFVSLEDLGFKLPPFFEIPVPIEMTDEMERSYSEIEGFLKSASREDSRRLGEYLQTTLSWPNAAFREITIEGHGTVPAVGDEPAPKEEWLVKTLEAEAKAGRKTLVFARQTGTNDIQPRLECLIEEAGLSVTTLHSSVSPAKREAWVAKRVSQLDVLVCNPRLVQTGLDLIAFSSIIFYEPDYSLYVVSQASRRTWRLGQTNPVRVYYPHYTGTMEHRAIGIIGKKIVAAQLLYGDDISAAFVTDEGGSLLQELAKDAASDSKIPDLRDLFASSAKESATASADEWESEDPSEGAEADDDPFPLVASGRGGVEPRQLALL